MTMSPVKESSDRNRESAVSFNMLGAIQALHSASEPFFTQVKLHGQLLSLEWAEEKKRLSMMFVTLLVGYAFFICFLFSVFCFSLEFLF